MTLSQRQRSSIYQSFVPLLGEEEAEALLAEFPSRKSDQPITREYLGEQLALMRVEMHEAINRLLVNLIGAMVGVAALSVGAVGIVVANVR